MKISVKENLSTKEKEENTTKVAYMCLMTWRVLNCRYMHAMEKAARQAEI
jgi:hypothetical protein